MKSEQLEENYNKLIEIINTTFTGKRKDNLLKLYDTLANKIALAPAAPSKAFHNCRPGGYILHVLKVIECAKELYTLWGNLGANQSDYTLENVIFIALNHDLGKVGDLNHDNYIENDSDWHIKHRGELYKTDPDIVHMLIPDRTLWLLQQFNVTVSQTEWIAIKVHDGLYVDGNGAYLDQYNPDKRPKSNLPYLIHHADHMASIIEFEQEKEDKDVDDDLPSERKERQSITPSLVDSTDIEHAFDDLFIDKTNIPVTTQPEPKKPVVKVDDEPEEETKKLSDKEAADLFGELFN